MTKRPVRIGNFSAHRGDRFTALDEVMAGDPVDVLMGDYLAELTLASLAAVYDAATGTGGYLEAFLGQLRPNLAAISERGLKLVTNAGGFNPAGLAAAVRAQIAEAGLDLNVAHVEGDNLLGQLDRLQAEGHALPNLDTGAPLRDWGVTPISANAYLGGFGIAQALAAGADIVVTGRVTDASLTAGPAAWWHGWTPDDWGPLAGAIVAGHIIECGAHATGGNFSGFATGPDLVDPGYPIAEIAADGSSVITKHAGTDGLVTVDTVTAQLVYEIQGPRYLNPDATVHLDSVELRPVGPDRVAIGPVLGSPPPPTSKVATFGSIGYQMAQMFFCTPPRVNEKVALLRAQLERRLAGVVDELEVVALGTASEPADTQWAATVAIRVVAAARERAAMLRFRDALLGLYVAGFPGLHHDAVAQPLREPLPRIEYWPALLATELVPHRVVLADGTVLDVPRSSRWATAEEMTQYQPPEPDSPPSGGRMITLGDLTYARAGDKGGNCNVGVWAPDPANWEWLRRTLTVDRVQALLPEVTKESGCEVMRHEFPHLRAVHLVLKGVLGSGGTTNLRLDQLGKSVGEYLRSKQVPAPEPPL